MLDGTTIGVVVDALPTERAAFIEVLTELDPSAWRRPTECPAYDVKGVATHVLGDDLSLLSRQRDRAENGLLQLGTELPGADFRTLLDTFNDRWVAAARFLSTELVTDLLRLTGDWTATYYAAIDPLAPGEPVGFFGGDGRSSPFWHAIAREYLERLVHHAQIRRAVGLSSLDDEELLAIGVEVAAAAAGVEPAVPTEPGGEWRLGDVVLGPTRQAADILTRAYTVEQVRAALVGPSPAVDLWAAAAGRP